MAAVVAAVVATVVAAVVAAGVAAVVAAGVAVVVTGEVVTVVAAAWTVTASAPTSSRTKTLRMAWLAALSLAIAPSDKGLSSESGTEAYPADGTGGDETRPARMVKGLT